MDNYNLLNLTLDELSLVDRPANQSALVTLVKRDTSNSKETKNMTDEEIAAVKKQNEDLRKALIDNGFVISAEGITKSTKEKEETIEVNGEQLIKSEIHPTILKALEATAIEKAALDIAKAAVEIEKAEISLTKRCETTLPHLAVAQAKVLLKAADALEDSKEFLAFLASVDNMLGKAMDELGKSHKEGDMASAKETLLAKVDLLTEEYKAKGQDASVAKANAYNEIAGTKDGAALITKASKE